MVIDQQALTIHIDYHILSRILPMVIDRLLRFLVFVLVSQSSRRPARSSKVGMSETPEILVTKLSKLGGKTMNTCSTIIVSEGRSSTSPRLLMRICTSVRKSRTLVLFCICRLEKLALMASFLALFFTTNFFRRYS